MRAKRSIFGAWCVGVVLVVTLIFIAPVTLKAYDASHPVTVKCLVSDVAPGSGSSRSVRGVGATVNEVRLDSPNCGVVVIRRGVSAESAPRIAAEIRPGRTHDFVIGAASYRFRDQLRSINQSIEVQLAR